MDLIHPYFQTNLEIAKNKHMLFLSFPSTFFAALLIDTPQNDATVKCPNKLRKVL